MLCPLPKVIREHGAEVTRPVATRLLAMTSAIDQDLKDIKQKAKEIGNEESSALPKP